MNDEEYEIAQEIIEEFNIKVKKLRLSLIDNNDKISESQKEYIYEYLYNNFRLWG